MTHDMVPDPTPDPNANPSLDPYIRAALAKKAAGLVVLDVGRLTSIADYFLICSGRSNRQVTAIAEHVQAVLKEQGIRPLSIEGLKSGHWVLMDYGHVIIHVFYDSVRSFYDLEGLWADARRIRTADMIAAEAADAASPEGNAGSDADAAAYTDREEMEVQDGSDPKRPPRSSSNRSASNRLCMLMILDGWGIEDPGDGNAVSLAETPTLDRLSAEYPTTRLVCSGESVGLPGGIMGNSEVGHLNIGAGRIVYQDLLRIDRSIADGSFFRNDVFRQVMDAVKQNGSSLHLMGLVSDGGVHSQLAHLLALLDLAREAGVQTTHVHAIMDGRDTSPTGGEGYLTQVQDHMTARGYGRIASICGRYYAMDRDKRWERIESAYRLYTEGEGLTGSDPIDAVRKAYGRGETDEFIKPIILTGAPGEPPTVIGDGDAVLFFNFRADRAREIATALTDPSFTGFTRRRRPDIAVYATMTLYDETFSLPVAFPPHHLKNILGEVVSRQGIRQLRIAETEKYAHVTYFFNGGEETPFPNEDRVLIPSPREVATYDEKPEMSAPAVTEAVLSRLRSGKYGMVILNFANMDMVGHTGVIPAAVKACETVDRCVAEIVAEVLGQGGAVLVTADHGNAEKMIAPDGKPHTAHTLNPVRLILVDDRRKDALLKEGKLGDIAPTMLAIMGIDQPEEMTGESIIR